MAFTKDQTKFLVRNYATVADTLPPFRHIPCTLETGKHLEQLKKSQSLPASEKKKTTRIFCGHMAVFTECFHSNDLIPICRCSIRTALETGKVHNCTITSQIRLVLCHERVALLHHLSCSIPCHIFIPDHDFYFMSLCGKHI